MESHILSKNIYKLGGDPTEFAKIMFSSNDNLRTKGRIRSSECYNLENFCNGYSEILKKYAHFICENKIYKQANNFKGDSYFTIIHSENANFDFYMRKGFFKPSIIVNIGIGSATGVVSRYGQPNIDDEFCLLGCLRRRCEQKGLILTLDPATHELIGFDENDKTGELDEIFADNVLQLRIRPAT